MRRTSLLLAFVSGFLATAAPLRAQRTAARHLASADDVRVFPASANNSAGTPTVITLAALARELEQTYASIRAERHVSGAVVLALFVDDRGKVTKSVVVESSGHAVLDNAALGAAMHARFSPAMQGDRMVSSWTLLPVEFRGK